MTPLRISKSLKAKLPPTQRPEVEAYIRSKSQTCYLCGDPLDFANEEIEADHVKAEVSDGPTTLDNLCAVHKECNGFKSSMDAAYVKDFLKFRRYAQKHLPFSLERAYEFFAITSVPVQFEYHGRDTVKLFTSSSSTKSSTIFNENSGPNSGREHKDYHFCFMDIPFNWVWNDSKVQPRRIYHDHVWDIYRDLLKNPLHEAPCVRLERTSTNECKLYMFDGQHKTVAARLAGYNSLVFKIYLDLEWHEANILVNSIQDQLIKKSLTVIESANKFSEEFEVNYERYIQKCGDDKSSEAGFLASLNVDDRRRAAKYLKAHLLKDFLSDPDLRIKTSLSEKKTEGKIAEKTFTSKFLFSLLTGGALKAEGQEGLLARQNERLNSVVITNFMHDTYWKVALDGDANDSDKYRASRMIKQAALEISADLIRRLYSRVEPPVNDDKIAFTGRVLIEEQFNLVKERLKVYFNHPYWQVDPKGDNLGANIIAADNHLGRNEKSKLEVIFNRMGLNLGYTYSQDLPAGWMG